MPRKGRAKVVVDPQQKRETRLQHSKRLGLTNKNPLITHIAALNRGNPRKDDSLKLLYEIAHKVSYIMKQQSFRVGQLVEFYPSNKALLGMNVNRGARILIRLRYPNDPHSFLPLESLVGTMLHELTHNLFGPHDSKFYSKLDSLSSEQWIIEQKGLYNTFLGDGIRLSTFSVTDLTNYNKLGSARISTTNGPRVLGNNNTKDHAHKTHTKTPRQMAAIAAERRSYDNKWCRDTNTHSINKMEHEVTNPGLKIIDLTELDEKDGHGQNRKGKSHDVQEKKIENKALIRHDHVNTYIEISDNDDNTADKNHVIDTNSTNNTHEVILIDDIDKQ
ncbi:uncharacterized protein SCODWIG_03775 [Saccharomycodes ludwigii]|uniref:WLM domain-containing protein n=1 Tax=Saccharomycodes ludwigii TaxID=36035 RepID=A0A376BBE9_9ASCO|nr:hypothetical protein SCDLUD_002839 [Saccharomycodes ludwigii]KAH3901347.1 hypothetical protein SCDLUD_002839 [Saccharomycodes ludwigii]SSD62013.1 uncharacterized protein SCODWIG_03775 [Saccharomycodes ludwigii]